MLPLKLRSGYCAHCLANLQCSRESSKAVKVRDAYFCRQCYYLIIQFRCTTTQIIGRISDMHLRGNIYTDTENRM